jgi:hypothetical protein
MTELDMEGQKESFSRERNEAAAAGANALLVLKRMSSVDARTEWPVRPILCSFMETPSDALHLRVPVCAQCAATTVRLESSVLGPLVILVWRCATCNHEWPVLTSDRERRGLLRERRASKL